MGKERTMTITVVMKNGEMKQVPGLNFERLAQMLTILEIVDKAIITYRGYRVITDGLSEVKVPVLAYTVPGHLLTIAEKFEWAANRIDHEIAYQIRPPGII